MVNLAELIGSVNVPESGTIRKMLDIPIDSISDDARNFYSMDDASLEELAASIELVGLQQPPLVRKTGETYTVVSGHRRMAALRKLNGEGKGFEKVPCIIEEFEGSAAWQEFCLICGNSSTRKLTSADLNEQAKRVTELMYELKEEGVEFPGRMRDYVAAACNTTKTKLSMLKVIDEKLSSKTAREAWKTGKLPDQAAYALAQCNSYVQDLICEAWVKKCGQLSGLYEWKVKETADSIGKVDKIECSHGGCCNQASVRIKNLMDYTNKFYCSRLCCSDCPNITTCRNVCYLCLSDRAAAIEKEKEKKANEKVVRDAADKPIIDNTRKLRRRMNTACERAGIEYSELKTKVGLWSTETVENEKAMLAGGGKVTTGTRTPLGQDRYSYEKLVSVCKALNVSADYLMGLDE